MDTNFTVLPLYERPQYADTCAAWSFAEWGCHAKGRTLASTIQRFHDTANNPKDVFQTWVCFNRDDQIAGMASLEEKDHPDFQNLSPWLGSVFVHPEARGHGIVHKLCEAVESGARSNGYPKIYLFTHTATDIYAKRGWTKIHEGRNPFGTTNTDDYIMMKELK